MLMPAGIGSLTHLEGTLTDVFFDKNEFIS